MSRVSFGRAAIGVATFCVAATAGVVSAPVLAEEYTIEEVLVTARKRTESAQDVPAAVSAFGAEELQDRGIDNIVEVARLTPNLTINETNGLIAGAVQVFIRGIGNDPGFDQGVGVYVDDVYLNRTSGALIDVYDVERIEVLKGPQGHLYGRNTIGGALKYISREPDEEFRADFDAKVGTDALRKFQAGVSGPLSDSLFGSVAISSTEMDGYQTNLFDGGEYASQDKFAARATLIWEATDVLDFKLTADTFSDNSDPYIPTRVAVNQGGASGVGTFQALLSTANLFVPGAGFLAAGETLDVSIPTDVDHVNTAHIQGGFEEYEIDTRGVALTANWDLADRWSLKSVTSHRSLENTMPFDFDGSHQVFINTLQQRDQSDFSQELQLNYSSANLNAVFGLYYLDGEFENEALTTQTPFLRLTTTHVKHTRQDDRGLQSTSAYANLDWDISEQWQLSLGGRYTKDEKDLDQLADVTLTNHVVGFVNIPNLQQAPLVLSPLGAQIFPNLPFFNFFLPHRDLDGNFIGLGNAETTITQPENKVGDESWSEFTPSFKVRFSPTDNTMLYAGYSSGFKSGGFFVHGREQVAESYEPETVDTIALGMKTTLLDGTLRINAELFRNDYKDKQVAVVTLENGLLIQSNKNVGDVKSQGGEVEILWLPPIDGLAINLNVGYLDIEINELIDQIPGTNTVGNVADDRALGYAPELTWQFRVQYAFNVGNAGTVSIGADLDYRDEMYTDSPIDTTNPFFLNARSEDRTLYNAFITYRSADDRWRLSLEGKNLSDKRVLENTYNVSNFILGGYNRARTVGLTVGYSFQ